MINRSRTPLKFLPDAAEFVDELRGMADCVISLRNLFEHGDEFRRKNRSAIFAVAPVFVGILLEITSVIHFTFLSAISK